jgi:hypothetical protein
VSHALPASPTRELVEELVLVSEGEEEAVSGGVPVCTEQSSGQVAQVSEAPANVTALQQLVSTAAGRGRPHSSQLRWLAVSDASNPQQAPFRGSAEHCAAVRAAALNSRYWLWQSRCSWS